MKYIIECAGCGTENVRYYLPTKCLCKGCGEMYYVWDYREVPTCSEKETE